MKICVFSDVHGNYVALSKMLETECNNVERYLFLGDIFGYFHQPNEIIKCFMQLKNFDAIIGNHDYYYLKSIGNDQLKIDLVQKYGASYNCVMEMKNINYLKTLPNFFEENVCDKFFLALHGGFDDFLNQRIYPDTVLSESVYGDKFDYIFLGHTHYRMTRKVGKTLIINPGSLGQPRDGLGFSYCIVDLEMGFWEFKFIKLDVKDMLRQVKEFEGTSDNYRYLTSKYEVLP